MAASLGRLCVSGVRGILWSRPRVSVLPVGVRGLCNPPEEFDVSSQYKEKPWEYLASTEYVERYGESLVWANYRRNHKGHIPPQKTRKKCIRAGKACGNPCPICRDQKLYVDYRNIQLLEQFICPYTGTVHDPTRTGVCMEQYKKLVKAITDAQDHGLLPVTILHNDVTFGDYSYDHGAVAQTPPAPEGPWYPWYEWQEPPAKDVSQLRKLYRPHMKKMMGEE
ncbi:PREDICTED: 28S ribosomal protein S18b, mitochondrial [Nanorana parkeri]|uniref:28S ribosomal protein S18b, mitochondrial n=1 Tax=Nanorana parkeri TaxID=125878 RepID=UPI000854614D|nr:PREDICTED: 28S ribosomal protein S18b, mitochondrial [Nanorana parkeri]